MAYDTPPTAVAGQKLTAADWNTKVRDSIIDVAKPARCRVSRAANLSIPNGGGAVTWTVEDYDSANMWAVGQPTRLVAPVGGVYQISFGAQFAINAAGVRILYLQKNGATILATQHGVGNAGWYVGGTVATEALLVANDYIECVAYQNTGAALNLDIVYPIWATMSLMART